MNTHFAFPLSRKALIGGILIPKFYDPEVAESIRIAAKSFDLPTLGDLLLPGDEGSRLGDWIPRENYGSGEIPYVRTSDLSHWRLRPDFKKGVSESVYEHYQHLQDVRIGDILFVAHGTYLVGEVAMVTGDEAHLVLQDHIFRLRPKGVKEGLNLFLLAALSTKFVKRQVRSRQFSADIIDKIGDR
jgi:type I restriction enzyme M protein